jgi:hypothetical protein
MIPAWLLRYAPHATIFAVILVAILWGVHRLKEQARDELRPVIERLQTELEAERAARIRNEEAINGYQDELTILRTRPRPIGPVRLCVPSPVLETRPPAADVDGPAAPARSDAGAAREDYQAGADIGPALRDLAYSCDAENAKLRALQGWVKSWVQ